MNLVKLGNNMTEIIIGNRSILISYQTPVALHIEGVGYFKTDCRWSRTTSKHIAKFLNGETAELKPQSFFDALLDEVK